MALKKLTYVEFAGEAREWRLAPIDFGAANLVVGRNATGKSRLINVITTLMAILSGRKTAAELHSGHFRAEFEISGTKYEYELKCMAAGVELERLSVNDVVKLERGDAGEGKIFYEREGKFLEFAVEPYAISIQTRKDRLQHPFIIELSEWAKASATYAFGSDFGKQSLLVTMSSDSVATGPTSAAAQKDEPNTPLQTYIDGYTMFGDAFDRAIVTDMQAMGFPVTAVHAEPLDPSLLIPKPQTPLLTLSLTEDHVPVHVNQITLSQGMFRSLALVIKLNWAIFSGRRGLILIDDLGEGLDYERACKAVELTMRKVQESGSQAIVTSNDRFVMNAVPLENWVALNRRGCIVEGSTSRNSPERFESFRFTGLSNFDFFTSNAFH